MNQNVSKIWRVLSVGNSFSVDTMEYVAEIAKACGFETVKLGNLYVGGCSIRRHFANVQEGAAIYEYFVNGGDGWSSSLEHTAEAIVKSEPWDVISIQHGSADGSRYAEAVYYEKLPALVAQLRAWAPQAKIAFNMTWVGEPYLTFSEIVDYGGDQQRLYEAIASLTETVVVPTEGIDLVSPTGTAVQNARAALDFELTRDGYHLSLDVGRYIAGLTFFKTLTGVSIDGISWAPSGVDEAVKAVAVAAANCAVQTPFAVTPLDA